MHLLSVIAFASLVATVASSGFSLLAPIPTARRGSVGGILFDSDNGAELWVTGGSNSELKGVDVGKNVEVYSTMQDEWREETAMPVSRSDHGAAALADLNRLYVAGGMSSCSNPAGQNVCNISSVSVYSPDTKVWEDIAPLNVARRGLVLASDEAKGLIYAVGGMDCKLNCYGLPVEYLTTIEVFDAKNGKGWAILPPMHTGRRDLGVAVINSILFAYGGCGGDGSQLDYQHCVALDVVERFDPSTQSWTTLTPMRSPRHGFASGVFGSQILVAGGTAAAGIDAASAKTGLVVSVDGFDTADSDPSVKSRWFKVADMPDPRDGLMKGYGLVVGTVFFLVSGSTKDSDYVNTHEYLSLRC